MKFSFHRQGVEMSSEQREHVETRLHFALGRFAPRVTRVAIHLADVNAKRGGVDKRCRMIAKLPGVADVIIEDHDSSLLALVDRVADRLGHTVSRRLERERFGKDRIAFDGSSPAR